MPYEGSRCGTGSLPIFRLLSGPGELHFLPGWLSPWAPGSCYSEPKPAEIKTDVDDFLLVHRDLFQLFLPK